MAYARSKRLTPDSIPVIDIGGLRDGSNAQSVASALHAASRNLGFIYVSNHGIDPALIEQARTNAFEFFRAPGQDKQSVRISANHRGWLSQGGSKMSDDAHSDLKESFLWGFEYEDGKVPQDHSLRGVNQWPTFGSDLKVSANQFYQQAHDVAFVLMRGFAIGLNLEPDFFLRQISKPLSRGSFVYYPPQDASLGDKQFGVAPHTDFGVLTILCQDAVGGLQVQGLDGHWLEAPPIKDTLVVNVGDLLSRWTNGEYRSTPHRVINSAGVERLSMVLAFDPDPDTVIDAKDITGDDQQSQHSAITCGDYLVWRFEQAFAHRAGTRS